MKFLFCFGYETPDQYQNNRIHGWDDEDSHAVWIDAGSKEEAMAVGKRFCRTFGERLFAERGLSLPSEWTENTFACWIEENPADRWPPEILSALDCILP